MDECFNKMLEEMSKQTDISSEIFNSIEDMKQLTSSMPNTFHEFIPQVEKMSKRVHEMPDEAFMALLEETICRNMSGRIEEVHQNFAQELFAKFDCMEQRIAVIKKYVKYGQSGGPISDSCSAPDTPSAPGGVGLPRNKASSEDHDWKAARGFSSQN